MTFRLLAALLPLQVAALPLEHYPKARDLLDQLAAEGLPRARIEAVLREAEIREPILRAIQRPAEKLSWARYRKIFLTEERITEGVRFFKRHCGLLEEITASYGIPPAIPVAILGVETFYGRKTGTWRAIDALATLAFAYPKRERFFFGELRHLFWLGHEEGLELLKIKGSYAGALGWPQFIPSSYRNYAVDFDGDGRRDLWQPADTLASVANYLKRHDWHRDEPIATPVPPVSDRLVAKALQPPSLTVQELRRLGVKIPLRLSDSLKAMVLRLEGERGPEYWLAFHNFYVITRYNHSPLYAMVVYQLAQEIKNRLKLP